MIQAEKEMSQGTRIVLWVAILERRQPKLGTDGLEAGRKT